VLAAFLTFTSPRSTNIFSRYYERKFVERTLSLDDSLIKEYFPVDVVVGSILEIYQDLLGVEFRKCEGEVWHPGELSRVLLCVGFK
jgi:Zn-dependent oligopeptidase